MRKPGAYPLTDGMRVRDLIYEAGGLKREAYLARAQLARTISDGSRARYIDQDLSLGEVRPARRATISRWSPATRCSSPRSQTGIRHGRWR